MYVDVGLGIYCKTDVPLRHQTHEEIVASDWELRRFCKGLRNRGFTQATRPAFEAMVKGARR